MCKKPDSSESELIALLKSNNKAAFEYLYDHYAPALYGIVCKIVKDKNIAEDVMQDSFLKIWKNISLYNAGKGTLFTWILNVARNTAIDSIRADAKFQYHLKWDLVSETDYVPAMISNPSYHLIDLNSGIKKLVAERKEIVELVYFAGYTHEEACEHLALPLGTVKSRIRTALQELRHYFSVQSTAVSLC